MIKEILTKGMNKVKSEAMKKKLSLYIIFFIVCSSDLKAQNQVLKLDTLYKTDWEILLKRDFNLDFKNKLKIIFFDKKYYLPEIWEYDDNKYCTDCKYLKYGISNGKSLVIMTNDGQIGTYLFYFDSKKIKKSWCQINELFQKAKLIKIVDNIYCVEFWKYNELNLSDERRYVFFDGKNGKLFNKVIDINNYQLDFKIDKKKKLLIVKLKEKNNPVIQIDYQTMKTKMFYEKPNDFILTNTSYTNISSLK